MARLSPADASNAHQETEEEERGPRTHRLNSAAAVAPEIAAAVANPLPNNNNNNNNNEYHLNKTTNNEL